MIVDLNYELCELGMTHGRLIGIDIQAIDGAVDKIDGFSQKFEEARAVIDHEVAGSDLAAG